MNIQKSLFILAATALLAGCASDAKYVDPQGTQTIISTDRVDIQDFQIATDALITSMLEWDAFAGEKKPRIALSTVTNDTANNFDTALLTNKIQTAILKTRKATVSMSMSADRKSDSVRQEMGGIGATEVKIPDFTLIGKISEVATNAGKTRQASYVFSMRLVDVKTGDVVWMDEKTITKQGKKNAVGW